MIRHIYLYDFSKFVELSQNPSKSGTSHCSQNTNKNHNMKTKILIISLLSMLFFSCGTRNVNRSKEVVENKENTTKSNSEKSTVKSENAVDVQTEKQNDIKEEAKNESLKPI